MMKYLITVLIFLLSPPFLAQSELEKIKLKSLEAFSNNNFIEAKDLFQKISKLQPTNKDNWFNLATAELNLKELDSACEHYYKAYLIGDPESVKIIRQYCPTFRNNEIKSIDEVDQKPRFLFEGKELDIFTGKDLNPIYKKLISKAINKSKIISRKQHGKLIIEIHIDSKGIFDGKILRIGAREEDYEIVYNEVSNIFSNVVKYIPAMHNGTPLVIWEKWVLPINFVD